MGNQHDPQELTRLEFALVQLMNGDGLRSLHDIVVFLERFLNVSVNHECGDVGCIIPEMREVATRFVDFMKEQNYQTLPAAAVYVDMGMSVTGPPDEEGIIHQQEASDLANGVDEWIRKLHDEGSLE